MEINLTKQDRLRVRSDSDFHSPFSDINNVNGLSITFYLQHQVFIIEKDGSINVFIFKKQYEVTSLNFGWWSDGNVIFTNSKFSQ